MGNYYAAAGAARKLERILDRRTDALKTLVAAAHDLLEGEGASNKGLEQITQDAAAAVAEAEEALRYLGELPPLPKKKRLPAQALPPADITDGWRLYRCDNGTYDAKHDDTNEGFDYHNLGNGRTELSAWVQLRELLAERHRGKE